MAHLLGRRAVGCDLNADYLPVVADRMAGAAFGAGVPRKPKPRPKPVPAEFVTPTLFAEVAHAD